jgi:TolA-binding protein
VTQFQAGEAYFAVGGGHSFNVQEATDPDQKAKEITATIDAYRKSISAHRGVVDRFPNSEYAPEALYVMAASHQYIADILKDDSSRQEEHAAEVAKMGAVYRELSEKYPESEHAAAAFLSVGNDYYNQASAQGLSAEEKTRLYKLSLESYRQALQVPGIEEKTRMQVVGYIQETEGLLAMDIYNTGAALVPLPTNDTERERNKENAPKAIPYFEDVIKTLPNTDYADLSYVQLGMCYEYLEDWEKAENAYDGLVKKYMDEDGNPISPFSDVVIQALQYARRRKGEIMAYRIAIRARQQSEESE